MQTRNERGDSSTKKALHIHGDLAVPKDWKSLLSVCTNKDRLIAYYIDYIVTLVNLEQVKLFLSVVEQKIHASF